MNKLFTLTAAVVALGIAGFVVSRRDGGSLTSATPNSKSAGVMLPAKTGRIDDDHDPARFESLDDGMKKIAEELEAAAIKWHRARPLHESVHKGWNDWDDYSSARIVELDTRQIRQLGEWVTVEGINSDSELNDYRQAIIKIWSSREPNIVRARLMEMAETEGFVGREVNTWRNLNLEELSDNFHHFRVGHAMHDPKSAWEAFLQDDADPRMKYLVDAKTTLPELFREYSSRAPEEAWSLALTLANEDYHHRMIEGFADGAPAGQDWEKRGRDLIGSLTELEMDLSPTTFEAIAERWVMEDPTAALDWFARMASGVAEFQTEDRFAPNYVESVPRSPEEVASKLKLDLLTSMYCSHKDRMDEVRAALKHLATHGSDPFAARALRTLIGDSLDPMDTALLELIPKFPSSDVRSELFLQAVRATPIRTGASLSSDSLEGPNLTLEAVRELAGQLDLTPEIRVQAEEAFRKVEAAEVKALEDQERLRRSKGDAVQDDPFSSR